MKTKKPRSTGKGLELSREVDAVYKLIEQSRAVAILAAAASYQAEDYSVEIDLALNLQDELLRRAMSSLAAINEKHLEQPK